MSKKVSKKITINKGDVAIKQNCQARSNQYNVLCNIITKEIDGVTTKICSRHGIKQLRSLETAKDVVPNVPKNRNDLMQFLYNRNGFCAVPIVYNKNYDVKLWNILKKLHPFDTSKWGKVHKILTQYFVKNNIKISTISPARPITNEELLLVHTNRFVHEITTSSSAVAKAAEIPVFHVTPISLLNTSVLDPMRWQISGSILAAYKALEKGWAINIGGGFHHASTHKAEGFCFFADITLIMKTLWQNYENLTFMIVDLDAHQGNGYARDILIADKYQKQVYIIDFFNSDIYPNDNVAKKIINKAVPIDSHIVGDKEYLYLLKIHLNSALDEFHPSLIIYNAGTDCLFGDPLGKLNLSKDGIILRDEYVFKLARTKNIPIVFLTSGGYQSITSTIIAKSIINLFEKNILN